MLKVAIAHSLELDSQDAIKELLEQCHEQLVDIMPQAGILFAGIDHDFELILDRINKVYPKIELIGGTTAGELSSVHGFADDSIVLTPSAIPALKYNTSELPVIGFYTYGEMGPLGRDKPARFHNETFFNLLIGVE